MYAYITDVEHGVKVFGGRNNQAKVKVDKILPSSQIAVKQLNKPIITLFVV